ncbi:MAG: hypothetical protein ABIE07_08365 [Candidatus Zixiibacteriota bacterium]
MSDLEGQNKKSSNKSFNERAIDYLLGLGPNLFIKTINALMLGFFAFLVTELLDYGFRGEGFGEAAMPAAVITTLIFLLIFFILQSIEFWLNGEWPEWLKDITRRALNLKEKR